MSENEEQNKFTQEMANWLRLLGMKQLVTVLESDVNDDKRKQAYQYSDGQKTTRDIAKLLNVTHVTISDWWKKWITLGLGEYISASGGKRFKRSFDLESLGMITKQKSNEQQENVVHSTEETSDEQ